jgi:hypothetical protein
LEGAAAPRLFVIVSDTELVQLQVDGGALAVLNEVLSWQTAR